MTGEKEAMLWSRVEEDRVRCGLCSHRCNLASGKRGICGVRENRDGTLYTLVYGRLIAEHLDPIEKKPLYHFLPGTASYSIATPGCNFRCDFCQNWQISQVGNDIERYPSVERSPEEVVRRAANTQSRSIAYTYTEPTIFMEFALDTARLAHERGIANVFVTNGFQTPEAVGAMTGLIDAANVDLKSFSDEFYRTNCKGSLQPVLETIKALHGAGIHVEVTTLVVPGRNDSADELKRIAGYLAGISPDVVWHVSRFHPDYKVNNVQATSPAKIVEAVELGREAGLKFVFAGNLPTTDYSDTVCPKCGKVVISRVGFNVRSLNLNEDGSCGFCDEPLGIKVAF